MNTAYGLTIHLHFHELSFSFFTFIPTAFRLTCLYGDNLFFYLLLVHFFEMK